jgi:hypothetical protein
VVLARLEPAQAEDEVGRLGPYRILRTIGAGATGVVFLAEDVQLRRRVGLKAMRPVPDGDERARQRFLREGRAAAVLDHEHVVTIYQVGEDAGLPYLAMKLLEGESLDDRLRREGPLPIHEVLRIGREVALGLAAAHDHGLVHRDIKPANIFLEAGVDGERGGRVKIVDFGLARAASDDLHLTRTGTIVGTPAYMSPEQARGLRLDSRSDLFSLGCVLYRMVTGRTPFQADDTMGMLVALAQDQPPPVRAFNPHTPGELAGLIGKLLAKVPENRPEDARGGRTPGGDRGPGGGGGSGDPPALRPARAPLVGHGVAGGGTGGAGLGGLLVRADRRPRGHRPRQRLGRGLQPAARPLLTKRATCHGQATCHARGKSRTAVNRFHLLDFRSRRGRLATPLRETVSARARAGLAGPVFPHSPRLAGGTALTMRATGFDASGWGARRFLSIRAARSPV